MRAIFAIITGLGLLAIASEMIVLDKPQPAFVRGGIGLLGLITILAGLYHARLRMLRRAAYRYGRVISGTAVFEGYQGEEGSIIRLRFSAGERHWRMTVDRSSATDLLDHPDKSMSATAWLGEDDVVYAIDAGAQQLLPISAGQKTSSVEAAPPLYQRNQKV